MTAPRSPSLKGRPPGAGPGPGWLPGPDPASAAGDRPRHATADLPHSVTMKTRAFPAGKWCDKWTAEAGVTGQARPGARHAIPGHAEHDQDARTPGFQFGCGPQPPSGPSTRPAALRPPGQPRDARLVPYAGTFWSWSPWMCRLARYWPRRLSSWPSRACRRGGRYGPAPYGGTAVAGGTAGTCRFMITKTFCSYEVHNLRAGKSFRDHGRDAGCRGVPGGGRCGLRGRRCARGALAGLRRAGA